MLFTLIVSKFHTRIECHSNWSNLLEQFESSNEQVRHQVTAGSEPYMREVFEQQAEFRFRVQPAKFVADSRVLVRTSLIR